MVFQQPTQGFQLLTETQRNDIVNKQWGRPLGLFGAWRKTKYDGIEYATELIIDLLRLLFQQKGLGYIYEDVPFDRVQVLNSWADQIEVVPDIVVTVGNYTQRVAEMNSGGRTDPQLDRLMPERYEIEFQLHVEGRNKMECDMLTAKFGSFFMELIIPTLAMNDPAINTMRQIRVSSSNERRRSSNFVTHFRTITFPGWLDYIPIRVEDKDQVFGGIDDISMTQRD